MVQGAQGAQRAQRAQRTQGMQGMQGCRGCRGCKQCSGQGAQGERGGCRGVEGCRAGRLQRRRCGSFALALRLLHRLPALLQLEKQRTLTGAFIEAFIGAGACARHRLDNGACYMRLPQPIAAPPAEA